MIGALLLNGCAQKNDTPEAVRQGIIRDLSGKFDMTKMDVVMGPVAFRDKEADATATFVVKGGSADQGMTMQYVMERHDDGKWYIRSRASAAPGGGDSAAGTMPTGHPAMGEQSPGAATSATGLNLPPGHPDPGQ
jgi:hypothetical protein